MKVGDRVTPIFSQSFLHGQYDPDYQKSGLGGGLDGVLREYFACDREFTSYPARLCIADRLGSGRGGSCESS